MTISSSSDTTSQTQTQTQDPTSDASSARIRQYMQSKYVDYPPYLFDHEPEPGMVPMSLLHGQWNPNTMLEMQLPRTSTSTTTWPWDMTLSPGFDDMTQARNAQFAANLPPVIMNPNDDPMAAMAEDPEYRREVIAAIMARPVGHPTRLVSSTQRVFDNTSLASSLLFEEMGEFKEDSSQNTAHRMEVYNLPGHARGIND